MNVERYLYRGVNPELYEATNGKLVPKAVGKQFRQGAYYGGTYYGDGSVYGTSERNTVIQHQRDSDKYQTSGISTTPIYENAKRYATHDGKYNSGYIYKLDTELFEEYGIKSHIVAEHATKPAIPEDKEVILVAQDFGVLPSEILVEVIKVIGLVEERNPT